jgi:hypothetical protein
MRIKITAILVMAVCGAFFPLFGADQRNTPLTVNLIVDGSQELSGVSDEVSTALSDRLTDGILQNGDRLTIWSAGKTARILYSDTIKTPDDIENIRKVLKNLPAQGDTADFSGALQNVASQKPDQNIQMAMLVSASHTTLSPALLGTNAQMLRFSRVEEYSGWHLLVVAPDINERVRQAAAGYFTGK